MAQRNLPQLRCSVRLIHPCDHLSIDQNMALIAHCIQKYFYSFSFLNPLLEYAHQVFERAKLNRNLVSIVEFFAESNEPILIYPILYEIYDVVVDRNRSVAEADHILDSSCILDVMKLLPGVKAGKDVT